MRTRRPGQAHSAGVLVDDSGRRHRWLRGVGSAITLLCTLFMLTVVASVFAPDGFVGVSLPVIAPAGTVPALPQAIQAPLPSDVLTPSTVTRTTVPAPTTTVKGHVGGPPTSGPSTGTTTPSPTTVAGATTTTVKKGGPPTSKPGQGNGKPTTTLP